MNNVLVFALLALVGGGAYGIYSIAQRIIPKTIEVLDTVMTEMPKQTQAQQEHTKALESIRKEAVDRNNMQKDGMDAMANQGKMLGQIITNQGDIVKCCQDHALCQRSVLEMLGQINRNTAPASAPPITSKASP